MVDHQADKACLIMYEFEKATLNGLKCLGFLSKTKHIIDPLALGEITPPILYLSH